MPAEAEVYNVLLPFQCLLALAEIDTTCPSRKYEASDRERTPTPYHQTVLLCRKRNLTPTATRCLGCRSLCGLRGRSDRYWSCLLSLGLDDAEKLSNTRLTCVVLLTRFIILSHLMRWSSGQPFSFQNIERSALDCIDTDRERNTHRKRSPRSSNRIHFCKRINSKNNRRRIRALAKVVYNCMLCYLFHPPT